MKLQFPILAGVILFNLAFVANMWVAQHLGIRAGKIPIQKIIPGTNQRFLYMMDWWVAIGDIFFVPFILNAFVHLALGGSLGLWSRVAWTIIFVGAIVVFLIKCLGPNHRCCSGFPHAGKISWHGIFHLPYLGIAYASGFVSVWHLFLGSFKGDTWGLSPVAWLGISAAVLYFACAYLDIRAGKFDPLKPIQKTEQRREGPYFYAK